MRNAMTDRIRFFYDELCDVFIVCFHSLLFMYHVLAILTL